MNARFFYQCSSSVELEEKYKQAYELFGLASRPRDHHLRKDLDAEYEHLVKSFQSEEKEEEYPWEKYSLEDILHQMQLLQLKAELCGKWVWLSDRGAFKHKDQLKHLGFRYAKNKKSWYWRSDEFKCDNQAPMPMDYIREKYGTQSIPTEM